MLLLTIYPLPRLFSQPQFGSKVLQAHSSPITKQDQMHAVNCRFSTDVHQVGAAHSPPQRDWSISSTHLCPASDQGSLFEHAHHRDSN